MRFLVTGSPRSATRYTAALLQALGVPCGHEHVCRPTAQLYDVLDWYRRDHGGESSWLAWAFLPALPRAHRIPVIHIRRNPWLVIDSLAHRNQLIGPDKPQTVHQRRMRHVIRCYCPRVLDYTTPIDRAAAFVVDWNAAAERVCRDVTGYYYGLKIESLDVQNVSFLLEWLGCSRGVDTIEGALEATPTNLNIGRQVDHEFTLTDPMILAFIADRFPNHKIQAKRISPATYRSKPEDIVRKMTGDLVEEVSAYAARFDYPTSREIEHQIGAPEMVT